MAYRHLSLKARLRLGTILLVTSLEARALTNAAQIRDFLVDRIANQAVANSSLIAGIYITDDQRRILNASHPVGAQGLAPVLPDFLTLQKKPILERLVEVLTRSQDYVSASKPFPLSPWPSPSSTRSCSPICCSAR
jgi:hypothetical protein